MALCSDESEANFSRSGQADRFEKFLDRVIRDARGKWVDGVLMAYSAGSARGVSCWMSKKKKRWRRRQSSTKVLCCRLTLAFFSLQFVPDFQAKGKKKKKKKDKIKVTVVTGIYYSL